MNKRQKQVQQYIYNNEKQVINDLKKIYRQALNDINQKLSELLARTDTENLSSIIYQVEYQKALKGQIKAILDDLNSKEFTTISEYLTECYNNGFIGTLYDLQGQGIPLIFPIDQEQVVKALINNSKISEGLYKKLGYNTEVLKKSIASELSRGLSQSYSYQQIALNLKNATNVNFNKSLRIARTEGHRISQESAYDCQVEAKKNGAEIVKQWDSTLDAKTRPDHVYLDGQIRELDKPFEVGGYKAMYPGGFGVASEDCNCRCVLLQRAKYAVEHTTSITKYDGRTKKEITIECNSYEEFKKKYWENVND